MTLSAQLSVEDLARAMFFASKSYPDSDKAHREWKRVRGSWEYKAARVLEELR